ncbi:MAG: hypothetical protein Q8O82_04430 [Pseudorhodobacter sp.]|nr:hypothetical protein [Pseudorhodobacter sp.]
MTRARPIPETVTVHVPFRIVKRGGRKEIQLPLGASTPRPRADSTMVKALARAFRWRKMLESGEFATVTELAEKERMAISYMARVLRMTHLAPGIVEAILEGIQPAEMKLSDLMEPFPSDWSTQSEAIASSHAFSANVAGLGLRKPSGL